MIGGLIGGFVVRCELTALPVMIWLMRGCHISGTTLAPAIRGPRAISLPRAGRAHTLVRFRAPSGVRGWFVRGCFGGKINSILLQIGLRGWDFLTRERRTGAWGLEFCSSPSTSICATGWSERVLKKRSCAWPCPFLTEVPVHRVLPSGEKSQPWLGLGLEATALVRVRVRNRNPS